MASAAAPRKRSRGLDILQLVLGKGLVYQEV